MIKKCSFLPLNFDQLIQLTVIIMPFIERETCFYRDQYFSYSQQEVQTMTYTGMCNEESPYPVDWNVLGIVPWLYSAHYLTQQGTTIREGVLIS